MLDDETEARHIVSHAQTEDFEASDLIATHRLYLLAENSVLDTLRVENIFECHHLYATGKNISQALGMVFMFMAAKTGENLLYLKSESLFYLDEWNTAFEYQNAVRRFK